MGRLQDVLAAQTAAIDGRLSEATGPLVQAYGSSWTRISAEVDRLTEELRRMQETGEEVRPGRLSRLARIRDLKRQVAGELGTLAATSDAATRAAQADAITAAQEHVKELALAASGVPPTEVAGAALEAGWNTMPRTALEHLVGALSDGSPVARLLVEVAGDGAKGFADTLTNGIIQGLSPRAVAAEARRAFGLPLTRTLRIVRTEALRSYRESTRADLLANPDVVEAWVWHSALDRRTCACCWAMHGTIHKSEERLDGHPNCRCAMVPRTKSWEELGFEGIEDTRPTIEPGTDLFKQAGDEVQREVLGKEGFRRYQTGELHLVDLLARRDNPEWGTMRYARSLKQVDLGGGGDWTGAGAQRDQKTEAD